MHWIFGCVANICGFSTVFFWVLTLRLPPQERFRIQRRRRSIPCRELVEILFFFLFVCFMLFRRSEELVWVLKKLEIQYDFLFTSIKVRNVRSEFGNFRKTATALESLTIALVQFPRQNKRMRLKFVLKKEKKKLKKYAGLVRYSVKQTYWFYTSLWF